LVPLRQTSRPPSPANHHLIIGAVAVESRPSAIEEIARNNKVESLVTLKDWDARYLITESLRFANWTVESMLKNRPKIPYRLYKLTPPVKVKGMDAQNAPPPQHAGSAETSPLSTAP
jgi:hypothetical protein